MVDKTVYNIISVVFNKALKMFPIHEKDTPKWQA